MRCGLKNGVTWNVQTNGQRERIAEVNDEKLRTIAISTEKAYNWISTTTAGKQRAGGRRKLSGGRRQVTFLAGQSKAVQSSG